MSFYNTKILTFISFIIFNTTLVSQIVDIETSRKEDLVGTKISLNLGFDGSSGTVDRTNYSIGTRFDFNNEVWNRFLIFNYSRREKDDRINEDNFIGWPIFHHIGGACVDDMLDNFDPERKIYRVSPNDTHPNGPGHEVISEEIYKAYKKVYG